MLPQKPIASSIAIPEYTEPNADNRTNPNPATHPTCPTHPVSCTTGCRVRGSAAGAVARLSAEGAAEAVYRDAAADAPHGPGEGGVGKQ